MTLCIDASAGPNGTISPSGLVVVIEGSNQSFTITPATGATKMHISTNKATWTALQPYATAMVCNLPAGDGTKSVYAQFADDAGNLSDIISAAITLDTTPPKDGILTATLGKGQVTLKWSGFSDATSGIDSSRLYYSAIGIPAAMDDNKIYAGTALTFTQSVPPAGNYFYRVCAVDKAGNVSSGAAASTSSTNKSILAAIYLLLD
jgi:hypothetical protein